MLDYHYHIDPFIGSSYHYHDPFIYEPALGWFRYNVLINSTSFFGIVKFNLVSHIFQLRSSKSVTDGLKSSKRQKTTREKKGNFPKKNTADLKIGRRKKDQNKLKIKSTAKGWSKKASGISFRDKDPFQRKRRAKAGTDRDVKESKRRL